MGDTGSGFYEARPVISIDGAESAGLKADITGLLVEETTEGMYKCEATFGNWGGSGYVYFERDVLDFGKTIAVTIGEGERKAQIFKGRISALEAHYSKFQTPDIVILAEDRLQDMRMTRRTRTFDNVSDADVIREIARGHSLAADIDIAGPVHKVLAQVNQSDLAFIRDRARAIDAEIWIEDNTLRMQKRKNRRREDISLTYQQGLMEFSVIADLASQRTSFFVTGWDVSGKSGIKSESSESALADELKGKKSGARILESAFGERKELVSHLSPSSSDEARTLSDSYFCRNARRFLTGHGTADCDGRIRVGVHLELKGLGELFNGEYYVTQVSHTFDLKIGCRTHFEVERAWIP